MKITERKMADLIAAEYNPRQMTKEQAAQLRDSMMRFGVVDPVIVNEHEDRKNIVVGGHQRLRIWRELGNETIPTVAVTLDRDAERELNVRLNKNTGDWDWDALANGFDVDELTDWGFDAEELIGDAADPEEEDPEVSFSEELMLEHNYIVLYFNNPLDWQVAVEKFGLKNTKSCDPAEKCQKIGIGRVIDGATALHIEEGKGK